MSSTLFAFVLSNPVGLLNAEHANWRLAFLVVTALSVPSFALLMWVRDRPKQMKAVKKEELQLIYVGRDVNKELANHCFSLRGAAKALQQRSVVLMIIATALAIAPTWLIVTWGTYGLLECFKVGTAKASLFGAIGLMIPVLYGINARLGGQQSLRPTMSTGAGNEPSRLGTACLWCGIPERSVLLGHHQCLLGRTDEAGIPWNSQRPVGRVPDSGGIPIDQSVWDLGASWCRGPCGLAKDLANRWVRVLFGGRTGLLGEGCHNRLSRAPHAGDLR